MADAHIEHVFDCTEDTYWGKVFFNPEYNRRLFLEALGFESWTLVRLDETPDRIVRVVDAVPRLGDLPGPLKKLAEGGVGYRETGTFDRKARRLRIEVEPVALKGKLVIGGDLYTKTAAPGKCIRCYDSRVSVKIFGIGGMVEGRIQDDLRANYGRAAEFTNRWLREQGLAS